MADSKAVRMRRFGDRKMIAASNAAACQTFIAATHSKEARA